MFIRTIGTPVALGTGWTLLPLNGGGDTPPRRYNLTNLMLWLDTIAGGATAVTIQVTHDANRAQGLVPYTPSGATQTISLGTDPTKGSVSINLGVFWASENGDIPRCWAKLDAGTANGTARLTGETEGQP